MNHLCSKSMLERGQKQSSAVKNHGTTAGCSREQSAPYFLFRQKTKDAIEKVFKTPLNIWEMFHNQTLHCNKLIIQKKHVFIVLFDHY